MLNKFTFNLKLSQVLTGNIFSVQFEYDFKYWNDI